MNESTQMQQPSSAALSVFKQRFVGYPVQKQEKPAYLESSDSEEVLPRTFPTSPSYATQLTSVYTNKELDRPAFNFEFSYGQKSMFDCYDSVEHQLVGGKEVRKVRLFYRESDGCLKGLQMFDKDGFKQL